MITETPQSSIEQLAQKLEAHIAEKGQVLVAFSGGVDSTVVLKAAHNALGEKALGILADTESNTDDDLEICRNIADEHQLPYEIIKYSELAIENYKENPMNRCFFCKNELYGRLTDLAKKREIPFVCDGSNADDVGDYRPGLKAVEKHRIISPLKELDITKAQVRELAAYYGLPNYDRPSSPCLSSRIPYGNEITEKKLQQVARMESYLRSLGLREFRCRHHDRVARLELHEQDFQVALENNQSIVEKGREIGFHWVALDLAGFKSGNLNRVLETKKTTN